MPTSIPTLTSVTSLCHFFPVHVDVFLKAQNFDSVSTFICFCRNSRSKYRKDNTVSVVITRRSWRQNLLNIFKVNVFFFWYLLQEM